MENNSQRIISGEAKDALYGLNQSNKELYKWNRNT